MKKIGVGLCLVFLTVSQFAHAHGEEKPGPHGGIIRMPGAFHTEVLAVKNGLKILLLDIDFKHPTIKDSRLKVAIKSDKATTPIKCETKADHFFCPVDNKLLQKEGTLEITPTRQKGEGMTVAYPLPLSKQSA